MLRAYDRLKGIFANQGRFQMIKNLFEWDSSVMMPEASIDRRADLAAFLEQQSHDLIAQDYVRDLLALAEEEALNLFEQKNLSLMHRAYVHAAHVPSSLVQRASQKAQECEMLWRHAKLNNDFASLSQDFHELLSLNRDIAAIKGQVLGLKPYDALLDIYDPGMTCSTIDQVFGQLLTWLPNCLDMIIERQKSLKFPSDLPLSEKEQEQLNHLALEMVGFDFKRGRLDRSSHPFCATIQGDARLTTRYNPLDYVSSLLGTMHEAGHSAYEMNLPFDTAYDLIGRSQGMTMHESQSLFYEKHIALNHGFQEALVFKAQNVGIELSLTDLQRRTRKIAKTCIRVDADEVSYPLHVILRYRIEQDLIAGTLNASDLPDRWNSDFKQFFGFTPPSDREGCLQDIHWYAGSFGYFPTYSLGALMAAQLAAYCRLDLPMDDLLKQGNMEHINLWLKEKVHIKGASMLPQEILQNIAGQGLDAKFYQQHIQQRYGV